MDGDDDLPTRVVERLGIDVKAWAADIRARVDAVVPEPEPDTDHGERRGSGVTPAGDLIAKARALATKWREDGGGVDAGTLVDLVYAVEALTPSDGLEAAVAIDAAVALLRGEGFTVTSPGATAGLVCSACGADYGDGEEPEAKPGAMTPEQVAALLGEPSDEGER